MVIKARWDFCGEIKEIGGFFDTGKGALRICRDCLTDPELQEKFKKFKDKKYHKGV